MGGYKINVRNCKYALVQTNTDDDYSIGTIKKLPAIRSVDIATQTATGELYGDGVIVANRAKITGAELRLGIDKLQQEARAELLGHTVDENGIMLVSTEDVPADIAMYMEIELDNGGYEAIWLLVGRAEPIAISGAQTESNITYTTDELTVKFRRRDIDNLVFKLGDTDNEDFDTDAQAAFLLGPDI